MKRRKALRHLFIVGGIVWLFPSCIDKDKKVRSSSIFLNEDQQKFLEELVNVIIPSTDTPGAKELGVPLFIGKMINDCQPLAYRKSFKAGLDKFPEFIKSSTGKNWKDLHDEEKLKLLQQALQDQNMDKDIQLCINATRELTIKGYANSEYVMTKLVPYQLIPGHFYGCIPISDKKEKI